MHKKYNVCMNCGRILIPERIRFAGKDETRASILSVKPIPIKNFHMRAFALTHCGTGNGRWGKAAAQPNINYRSP